jgi:Methyltransferase domain
MEEESKRAKVRDKLLGRMPKGGIAAEIGVWEGKFSERIIEVTQPKELHLIDPWLYQPEFNNTGFGRKKNESRMDEMFHEVAAKFASNSGVKLHRAMSKPALDGFPDGYFDWVYIDGNHNEPFVGEDLALCRRKVKPGGIIAGDDFNWQAEQSGAPVRRAVEALVAELGPKAKFTLMGNQYMIVLPA